jgi:amino acid transporter
MVVAAGHNPGEWQERGIAIGLIVFVTLIHTFTPRAGVYLMNVLGSIKVMLLLFIVITGFVVLGGGVKTIHHPTASFQNAFAGSASSGNLYASALFKVLNSYAG